MDFNKVKKMLDLPEKINIDYDPPLGLGDIIKVVYQGKIFGITARRDGNCYSENCNCSKQPDGTHFPERTITEEEACEMIRRHLQI